MISTAVEYTSQTLKTITDRSQYQHCHIEVPDMATKLPAISFNQQYYYFFRSISDQQRAASLAAKLIAKGDTVVMTTIPKGLALWVLEPNAQLVPKRVYAPQPKADIASNSLLENQPISSPLVATQPVISPDSLSRASSNTRLISGTKSKRIDVEDLLPFPIILDPSRFADCQIHVPDLDEVLAAISFAGNYYSFFRTLNSAQDLVPIARKLAERGDDAVITCEASRYSIWVLEPGASVLRA